MLREAEKCLMLLILRMAKLGHRDYACKLHNNLPLHCVSSDCTYQPSERRQPIANPTLQSFRL